MRLTWLNNKFICKALYAPFKINKDSDYINDLKNKYDIVYTILIEFPRLSIL